jgi:hypothetical protein
MDAVSIHQMLEVQLVQPELAKTMAEQVLAVLASAAPRSKVGFGCANYHRLHKSCSRKHPAICRNYYEMLHTGCLCNW